MKVLAAIVTYNRVGLLERCLDHIDRQSRVPDGVIVINNGSTDDTERVLKQRSTPFITQENLGGAGGFRRAIDHALAHGYDAVWLMDDDGFPEGNALALLRESLTQGVACVSSVLLREDDPRFFVFPYPALDGDGRPAILAWPRKLRTLAQLRRHAVGSIYPFVHLFNGALISCEAIRRTGNVEAGFFIFGDELDYLMRLQRAGRVISHVEAHHFHPDVASRPLNDVKLYYYIKNTLILNRRYMNHRRLRNALTVAAGLGRMAARNGPGEALSFLVGRRRNVLAKAISRGLDGRIGNDFDV